MMSGMAAEAGGGAVAVQLVRLAALRSAGLPAGSGAGGIAKADQQAFVAAAVHVIAARPVATLATASGRFGGLRQLAVRRIGDLDRHILVAGEASLAAHVLRSLRLRRQQRKQKQHGAN